ncbi:phosphatidylethanolamine-binding protein [Flagelloscypha sp. PMI_526]|nr:phosphatidylethanolamine-binding protein [Flagelloscypha sp. PMI_526]
MITDLDKRSTLTQTLKTANVIPGILPEFERKFSLKVTFSDGTTLDTGATIKKSSQFHPLLYAFSPHRIVDTASEPKWSISGATAEELKGKAFTIFLVDPDAPKPEEPTVSQVIHFAQTDFVVQEDLTLISTAVPLTPYHGPNPPAISSAHRYIPVIYEQTSGIGSIKAPSDFPTDWSDVMKRLFFNVNEFSSRVEGQLVLASANLWYTAPEKAA